VDCFVSVITVLRIIVMYRVIFVRLNVITGFISFMYQLLCDICEIVITKFTIFTYRLPADRLSVKIIFHGDFIMAHEKMNFVFSNIFSCVVENVGKQMDLQKIISKKFYRNSDLQGHLNF
jgi:hypothetical protein